MITTAQAVEAQPTEVNAPAPSTPPRARRGASATAAVRRLPSCDPQPPFDDEVAANAPIETTLNRAFAGDSDHGQRALRLVFALPGGLPAQPEIPDTLQKETAPDLRLLPALTDPSPAVTEQLPALNEQPSTDVTALAVQPRTRRRTGRRDSAEEDFGPQRTARTLLPAPTPWAGRLVQAILEVTSGVRPVSQLVRWTTAPIYEELSARLLQPAASVKPAASAQPAASVQPARSVRPAASTRGATTRNVAPTRLAEVVRSVRVSEPSDGVAEVCAIVQQGPRCRAIALRLEGIDGRWQCTALQIG